MARVQLRAVMTKQILLLEHTQTMPLPHLGVAPRSARIEFLCPCATRPASHQAPRKQPCDSESPAAVAAAAAAAALNALWTIPCAEHRPPSPLPPPRGWKQ